MGHHPIKLTRWASIVALFTLLTSLSLPGLASPWQILSSDSQHLLEQHTEQAEGVVALRLSTTMDASMAQIIAVLEQVEHYPEFLPHFRQVRRLGSQGDSELVYFRIEPPFIKPRDYVLAISNRHSVSGSFYQRQWHSANQHAPEANDQVVRLWLVEGSWQLIRIDDDQTRVVHQIRTDMGGNLPNWLIQMASEHGLKAVVNAVAERAGSGSP